MTGKDALSRCDEGKYLIGTTADEFGVPACRVVVDAAAGDIDTALLHLRGMHAHMAGRFDGKTARQMRTVIDTAVETGLQEMTVDETGKGLADLFDLHLCGRQAPVDQPSVLALDQGLFSKPVSRDRPGGHDDMGMDVALVALALRHVNGEVDGSAETIGKIGGKGPCQRQPTGIGQFMRKGDLELAGDTGIAAAFGKLCGVPEQGTIARPRGIETIGQDDFRMNDALLCGEVVRNAFTFIEDPAGGAIGDGGDRTFAGIAADRFYAEMIDRHAVSG